MAALPDVRRQAASCRCAISAPGGPASIGSSLCGIGDGGRKLQLRPDRQRPRRRASAESSSMGIAEHAKNSFFKTKNHILSMDMLLFENLLKPTATLQGGANDAIWVLKPDYHKF
ncbi:hypothetical protein OsI_28340 [Oryza sativa Indica Group]|uniref:Uncharacterized protein n=1 Tax=Oryza sativa subsp. indica TaxID=39946 RepID=A2YSP2_ORYSI|nr:hypothetical protein OsI_28340 [Oryza sativa Indica Group]